MLLSALFSGDVLTIAVTVVAAVFLVFVSIPVHELAHAWAAYKLGDHSVKDRLTFNPLVHIDPVGAVMIALIGFGWGRPCQVNPYAFKNEKKDMALVAAAGPISNLLMGWLFIFIATMLGALAPHFCNMVIGQAVIIFFSTCAQISIWLGVLNLLPIPMFDGFTVLRAFISSETEYKIMANQQMISIIVIILLFSGIITKPISLLADLIMTLFSFLSALPFSLFLR
ncbi:MAG: site-2 protease family protein [Clostridia bacterium]|nr:site-2 protease family protein [Clostridia bacterium]